MGLYHEPHCQAGQTVLQHPRKTIAQPVWHSTPLPPKVYAVKTVYFVKRSTQVKMALQPFAQDGNLVMKSIGQDPNLLSAMGNGSSNPGGACVLSLAC